MSHKSFLYGTVLTGVLILTMTVTGGVRFSNVYAASDGVPIEVASEAEDLVIPAGAADPDHLSSVTVDISTGEAAAESGETAGISELLDLSEEESEELIGEGDGGMSDRLLAFLDDSLIYNIVGQDGDKVELNFPFAYKRLLVFAKEGSLADTYGAVSAVYYPYAGEYILDYDTEQAAGAAYECLSEDFGRDSVLPDLPVQSQGEAFTETAALSDSWGLDLMHLDEVRDVANQDETMTDEVIVAVLDSGFYPDHELFSGRLLSGSGVSFVSGASWEQDDSGHGTHVGGIIADGTSRQIKILPVKVLDAQGRGGFAEILNGIYYASEQHADVINMSLAINLNDYGNYWADTSYIRAEQALVKAEEAGCISIAAAGNDSANMNELAVYPAISEHTVTVSSINRSLKRASSSNYGPGIDYAAPGDQISSASPKGPDRYVTLSGTSMAAPHMTAAVAMLRLYNRDLTVSECKELMRSATEDLGSEGWDKFFGNGILVFKDGTVPIGEHKQTEPEHPDLTPTAPVVSPAVSTPAPTPQETQAPATPALTKKISIGKASVKLSAASYVWNGKARKPSVTVTLNSRKLKAGTDYTVRYSGNKNVGKATVTIKGKGSCTGTVQKTFRIVPKSTAVKKVTAGKRAATVTWKKQASQTTGYQIQYSASKSFKTGKIITVSKTGTTKYVIKNLKKGKRYYVRIRTFRKAGGSHYYSAWSETVRSAKIK